MADNRETKKLHISATSMESLYRAQLESKLTFKPTAVDLSKLPAFELPDLKQIRVTVPPPMEFTDQELEDELQERVADLLLSNSKEEARKAGEPVQWGDRVRVDVIPYVAGKIIPQGIQENLEILVEPDTFLPGFADAVIENTAGSTFILQCEIPDDYPAASVQGQPAAFSITIREAVKLTPPDPDDPEFLASVDLGDSFDAVTESILEDIVEQMDAEHELEGVSMALEALAEYARPAVTDELLETVLRNQWIQREWRTLQARGIPEEDCNEALKAWIQDADLRSEMAQQLATSLAIQAVGVKDGLMQPPQEEFDQFLEELASDYDMDPQEFTASLSEDPAIRNQLYQHFVYMRIVDHVTGQVQIEFARPTV